MKVSASILGFCFEAKKKGWPDEDMIEKINSALKAHESEFQSLQYDVMDGEFVENKSFTAEMLRKVHYGGFREVHLMVKDYEKYLKEYFDIADMFIFHQEVLKENFGKLIENLHSKNKKVAIAINPETKVEDISYIEQIDMVLVMSVNPGLPGQGFIDSVLEKVEGLKRLREKKNLNFLIEVDGGIKKDNMESCREAGADIVVMGTGLFDG